MSNKFYITILILLFAISGKHGLAQNNDVNVVIASGFDVSQISAFSPDDRFVANVLYNEVTIWDAKTGRLLRSTNFSDELSYVPDSMWFSEDNKYVMLQIATTNDKFKIDIATGESEFIKGPPFDWSTYKYEMPIFQKASMHLYSGKNNDLVFPSPDGKTELVYKLIDNPFGNTKVIPKVFETHVRTGNELSPPLDTVTQVCFAFSNDGRYVFSEATVFDLHAKRVVSRLRRVPFSGESVMFWPDTRLAVTSGFHSLRIWDFPDVEDIKIKHFVNFKPSLDRKVLVCEAFDLLNNEHMFYQVDLEKKKKVGKTFSSGQTGYLLNASDDGNRFAYLEMIRENMESMVSYNVKIMDFKEKKLVHTIKNSTKCFFTKDPNVVLIDSTGMGLFTYNLESKKVGYFTQDKDFNAFGLHIMADDHLHLCSVHSLRTESQDSIIQVVRVWNTETRSVVFSTEVVGIVIDGFNVSLDGSRMSLYSSVDHALHVYDLKSGNHLMKLQGHKAIARHTRFSDDNKRLISSSLDGTKRIWNLETKKEMVSLINTGGKDYAILTPENYYYATKGAKALIHFVKGTKIYPFAQFDLKYNRPDIIIETMEASNQGLVKPFYYAYQKRLKRLGFTEEMLDGEFHMPEASINNAKDIPITTDKRTISLDISALDEKFNLDRLLVRVNEVPIHGKKGLSLKKNGSNKMEKTVDIDLSVGSNFIDVSVMNEKGVESLGASVNVDFVPEKGAKPNLYLYTIGVSEYEQSQFNLTYAAKDANDINALYTGDISPYNQIFSHSLTNDQVTIEAVQGIKKELMKTNVDDAVCVFFAGHGVLDVELNYFLASYDMDFTDPGNRGIAYEVFEDILDQIPARKKLIMIDACHSGEIDKEEVAMIEEENSTESEEDISFRAVTSTTLKRVGLNNSFELMKELFNDVKKNSGTVVISSAGGMEYAMEGGEWNNGVFTYCFLNGIKNGEADLNQDGKIMVSEMNSFVREKVFTLTGGKQQPTTRAEVLEADWQLW